MTGSLSKKCLVLLDGGSRLLYLYKSCSFLDRLYSYAGAAGAHRPLLVRSLCFLPFVVGSSFACLP